MVESVLEEGLGRRGIAIDVVTILKEEVMSLTETVAHAKTTIEGDTDLAEINSRCGVVEAEAETTTSKEVEVEATVGVIAHDSVVQREQHVQGKGGVAIHSFLILFVARDSTVTGLTERGETETQTPVKSMVQFLLGEDGHTGVGGNTPVVTEVETAHDRLVVEVYRSTD